MKKILVSLALLITMVLGFSATQVFADVDTSQDFFSQADGTFTANYFAWNYTVPANSGDFVFQIDFSYLKTQYLQYMDDQSNDEIDLYFGSRMYENTLYNLSNFDQSQEFSDAFPDYIYVSANVVQIPIANSGSVQSLEIFWGNDLAPFDMQDMDTDFIPDQTFSMYASDPGDVIEPEFTYSNLSVDTVYNDLVTAAEVKAQLHATDDEDGDVSSRIEVYDDQYTSKTKVVGGDYYIMYRVSDLSGNYAYLRVDIEVIDNIKPYFVDPVNGNAIYNDGATFSFSWYDDEPDAGMAEVESLNNLVATDEYYGPIYNDMPSWTVEEFNDYPEDYGQGPWQVVPGVYHQTVTYTDPSGNSATFSATFTVLNNDSPVITGPSELTVEATTFSLANILTNYSATDTEDGTVTVTASPLDSVTYSNVWTAAHTIGDHTLYLSSVDSFGIETIKSVTIHIVDTTVPVIKVGGIASTTYTHTVLMSNTASLATLIGTITASDAYYGNITSSLVIPAYPNFTTPGSTDMTITVTDASGSTATLILTVIVEDDIAPVINGPIKIVKGKTATLTLSEVTVQLSAIDNVDGTLSVSIAQDGYTGHATTIGSYLVRYQATDSAGNVTFHDVRIWVVDNVAPVWVVDDYFINLGLNESMTRTELVALLQASGMLANDISYTVTFLTDEYSGSESIEGVYSVVMRVTYEDGSEDEISVQLSVPEDVSEGDIIVVEPEVVLTGFQQAWLNIKTFFVSSWDWIKGAVNTVKNAGVWVYDNAIKPAWDFFFVKDTDTIPDTVVTTQLITTTSASTTSTLPYSTTTTSPAQNL
ncbi:MAG: hypothetical protein KKE16_01155 [Firmicutes bacterium]|nr:hypothetical protein [Bacillota bacterium]